MSFFQDTICSMKLPPFLSAAHLSKTLLVLFFAGIVAIFWSFLASFGLGESGYNFLGKTKKVTLSPGSPVTQTFTAHKNYLSQVRVVFGNVHLRAGDTLELSLLDENCHEILFTSTFKEKPREQGAYTPFSFPPISDSEQKKYCFMALYSSNENRKGEKPYLSALDDPDPLFIDRTLTDHNKNKVYPSQTLFLRPAYSNGSLTADLAILLDRLSQDKPYMFNTWTLMVLFGVFLIGCIALAYHITSSNTSQD